MPDVTGGGGENFDIDGARAGLGEAVDGGIDGVE